ncbi:MAG: zeta toxin family protein [Anaerolineales bacterium]|jgi:uridine kinase
MIGDVLLITENHKKAAQEIIKKILQIQSNKIVIAISGESGSGKSELAHMIAKELKMRAERAKILHTDNYYLISPIERTAWRIKNGISSVGLSEYNWDLLAQNVKDFKQDKESTLPCIDLLTDQEDRLITNFSGIRYLLLEGLYALKIHADLKIFIDLTYHETKKAQIMRGKEPQNLFRIQVLQREHEVVKELKNLSDIIVTRDFNIVDSKSSIGIPLDGTPNTNLETGQ